MIRNKDNFFRTSDETIIYFEDYGKGTPILIIPGFLCTSKYFSRNIEGLSKKHRLILIDARGHGSSSKTLQNLTIPRMAQDVKELVSALKLEDLTLLGWSMGSSVALSYYDQFGPYKLKKIGIIDSALYPFSPEPFNSHSLAGFNMDGMCDVMNRAVNNHEEYCRGFARAIFKNKPSQEDEDWSAIEMTKTPPWIAFAIYTDFLFRDYVSALSKIEIPVLIAGADSPAIPRGIEMARSYLAYIKGDKEFHAFENEGHVMFYENPDKFNRMVLEFVEKS